MIQPPAWYENPRIHEHLAEASTATLTTQLLHRGFRTRFIAGVHPVRPGSRMVGYARTLRYIPMREDLDTLELLGDPTNPQRKLIDGFGPGQVLVIDAMRQPSAGSLGSILALRLQTLEAAGIVTDGAYRDTPAIRELAIPAYAAGEHANANITAYHPADMDLPVGCGGVMVVPGDAIVGDDEGVVVIPSHLVEDIARDAYEQELREEFIAERVGAGSPLAGTYPMGDDTRAAYHAWRAEWAKREERD